MQSGDITDLAFDLGLQSPRIATSDDEWSGIRMHYLTFGPLSDRQTITVPGNIEPDQVREILQEAIAPATVPAPEPARPVYFEGQQWTPAEMEKLKKRARKKKDA